MRAVARKLPDFRKETEGATFRGWLRRITQNKLRDHFRNQARHPDQAVGGTDGHQRILRLKAPLDAKTGHSSSNRSLDPQGSLSSWGQELVARVRGEVSDRDWRFFWRVVVDGQSAAEVGEEYGVTANAVRLVKMRVLRRLREHLATQRPPRGPTADP